MIVTLDWESYFDKEYSLKKLTTEEYVRDARFKAHGLAIKFGADPARWFPPDVLLHPRMRALIEQSAVLCHHAQFDGLILSHHYGLYPALWLDTLSMARICLPHNRHSLDKLSQHYGLPGKMHQNLTNVMGVRDPNAVMLAGLGTMACDDADKTYTIAQHMLPQMPRDELQIIDMTIRMFTEPQLRLDEPKMRTYHTKVVQEKEDILNELGTTREELQSADKFAAKLRELGIEPDTKPGKHGPIFAFAKTDAFMRELQTHDDDRVCAIAGARLGIKSTLAETRTERLLSMATRGSLAVYLRYAGAHTTRWSGGDSLNWQNFQRGGEIRQSIMAPPGQNIVVADSSQIECRIVNWLAGQWDVIERFRNKQDPYVNVASQFYGREITKADKVERQLGKTLELGAGFGMGAEKLRITCARGPLGGAPIHLTAEEADRAIQAYRQSHKAVANMWWRTAESALGVMRDGSSPMQWGPLWVERGRIVLPNGLPMRYDHFEQDEHGETWCIVRGRRTKLYGGKLVENVVQALARVVLSETMLRVRDRYRVVNCTHDEIMCLAPIDDTEALGYILSELKKEPSWAPGLPLDAEGAEGVRYSK